MNGGGIMFDTTSPIMSGWWYNPRNGDSFEVRDCYFDNNEYKVQTTDGRILDYNTVQNYVQSDKPIKKQPKINPAVTQDKTLGAKALAEQGLKTENKPIAQVVEDATISDTTLPASVLAELGATSTKPARKAPTHSINYEMIDRVLAPKMENCEMETKCKWGVVSEDEIKVLVNMMKIEPKEIAQYLYEKKCSKDDIIAQLETSIKFILED